MSIFRKASENEKLPGFIDTAFFDNSKKVEIEDEFGQLLKEASSNKSIYEDRLNSFKKNPPKEQEVNIPQPVRYSDVNDGIRRSSYGQKFHDETSEYFRSSENIRSTQYDNSNYAQNGFSIWEPEFDELQNAFLESQKQSDEIYDRRTAMEKKAAEHKNWESKNINSIRKANVLPYRGLGIKRLANDVQVDHNKLNNVNEFYAEAHDSIREMTKAANRDRKAKLSRNGSDINDSARTEAEIKEAISARTMEALQSNSQFLIDFAEKITINER